MKQEEIRKDLPKYVYCVMKGDEWREFAIDGIGDNRVYTINYLGLAAVVSDWTNTSFSLTPEITKSHHLVVKKVFKGFTVIPVNPGCIAKNVIRVKKEILRDRADYLHRLLHNMDNKVELGLKALWKRNPMFANSIDKPDLRVKSLRQALAARLLEQAPRKRVCARIRLSEMVMKAVADFREREASNILTALDPVISDQRIKAATSLKMILNAAFLVSREREQEFHNIVSELTKRYGEEVELRGADPLPPYSFANLVIKLD